MPDAPIRIHGYPVSTWTRTLRMTCAEKGLDYELVPVPYGSEEHGALHPFRRIPILEVGETVIFETLAATGYVDEAFDGPPLQPADVAGRAAMRTWMGVCGDYLFRQIVRGIPRDRTPSTEETETAREALDRAESILGNEGGSIAGGEGAGAEDAFLVGGAVSLADLYLAPQLANCREKAPDLLAEHPRLTAWLAAIEQRPSFTATEPG
jgi:glutathione S-transferase